MNQMNAEQLRAELERIANHCEDAGLIVAPGELRNLAARLSGVTAAPAWQPIETAPRDSRKILVGSFNVYGEWRTHLAWWRLPYEGAPDKQCSWCYDKDGTLLDASIHSCGATHWMPLPAAPEPTNA